MREVKYGVPQGSILGPLLFLIAINDLEFSMPCKSILYADDTTLIHCDKTLSDAHSNSKSLLCAAKVWFCSNGLVINDNKTQTITFSLSHVPTNNDSVKLLGFTLDPKLTWHEHINNVACKLSRVLFLILRSTFHSHNTRQADSIDMPRHRLAKTANSLNYLAIKFFNKLPARKQKLQCLRSKNSEKQIESVTDEDRNFLESLIPHVKMIKQEHKLLFKNEIQQENSTTFPDSYARTTPISYTSSYSAGSGSRKEDEGNEEGVQPQIFLIKLSTSDGQCVSKSVQMNNSAERAVRHGSQWEKCMQKETHVSLIVYEIQQADADQVCNSDCVYFVVWSPHGIVIRRIERDKEFWRKNMRGPLDVFYLNFLLPEICRHRAVTGLRKICAFPGASNMLPYYPQASQVERVNRNILFAPSIHYGKNQDHWNEQVIAFNSAIHKSTECSPASLFFCWELNHLLEMQWGLDGKV
ncbi:hypothetical protein J437_LFUL011710 [Ladona fulva]|uniref:Reverse transcriptase domain-containing protein n=1 Tax=Ladona fulva TaxID=123851 RepID=A0A8K0KPY4_LADFU|nr:hypothetical protein J437_LFUL011710 [Ladona fulva]